jgi:hypothetical protein
VTDRGGGARRRPDRRPPHAPRPGGGPRPAARQNLGQVRQGRAQLCGQTHLHADGPGQEPDQAGPDLSPSAPGRELPPLSKHLLPGSGPGPGDVRPHADLLRPPPRLQGTVTIPLPLPPSPYPWWHPWQVSCRFKNNIIIFPPI